MAVSRRAFVRTLAWGSAGVVSGSAISARGREATTGDWWRADPDSQLTPPAGIRLDSNENPNGPAPAALDAVRAAFGEASRYPRSPTSQLIASLARLHGVAEENIVAGAGSGEILRMAVYAFTSPAKSLVQGAPTFEDPARYAELLGTPVRAIPVDRQLRLDLDAMASQVDGAGLVFLCNPNNPTATVHPATAVAEFVARVNKVSPATTILVDEAYHHFVDDPGYKSAIPLAMQNPRVIVCRTFSKIYGMAGLRIGYAIGHAEPMKALRRHRLGNGVNVLGAAAAIASLPLAAHVEREKQLNREARELTRKAFASWGYQAGPSEANFIMVDIRRDAAAFQKACRAQAVMVGRVFPPLTTHARISIGTEAEMRKAIEVFRKVLEARSTTH
jgi:histidinol-phosphate aminotransferase